MIIDAINIDNLSTISTSGMGIVSITGGTSPTDLIAFNGVTISGVISSNTNIHTYGATITTEIEPMYIAWYLVGKNIGDKGCLQLSQ